MKINPKYKLVQSTNLKDTKKYVKDLENQLQKSKIAVENITTFKLMQKQLRTKIDQIQTQLHNCMLKINSENKKQKILIELISMMKGQQFQYQTKQKLDDQIISNNLNKQIHKIEYHIQQILQKHNEEIAKINSLKEQANGCRSQRVVYSNLFKKLEKEIKHNQEVYKLELLKTEEKKLKRSNETNKFNASINRNTQSQTPIQISLPPIHNLTTLNKFETSYSKSILPSESNHIFITTKDNSKSTPKKHINNQSYLSVNNPKLITNKIYIAEQQLKKIKVYGGYESLQQLTSHYETVEQQNNQLSELIQQNNLQIQRMQYSNELMEKQKANQTQNNKLICQRKSQTPIQHQHHLPKRISIYYYAQQLVQLLNIPDYSPLVHDKANNEALAKIDSKVQVLFQYQSSKENIKCKNREQTNISDTIIEFLLDRMDPVEDYRVIMDQLAFKQEYFYEINKDINKDLNKGKKLNKSKKL